MVSLRRALLCASLLFTTATTLRADYAALPRRYLNSSSISPFPLAPPSQSLSTTSPTEQSSSWSDGGATPTEPEKDHQTTSLSSRSLPSTNVPPVYGTSLSVGNSSTSRTTTTSRITTFTSRTTKHVTTSRQKPATTTTSSTGKPPPPPPDPLPTGILDCTPRASDEPITFFLILPNPSTVTVTLGGNFTKSLAPLVPEFVPPTPCPEPEPSLTAGPVNLPVTTTTRGFGPPPAATPPGGSNPLFPPGGPATSDIPVTTVITTSKNPVTVFTTAPNAFFSGISGNTNKQTVEQPANAGPNSVATFPANAPSLGDNNQDGSPVVITTEIQGVLVEIRTDFVVIGGSTFAPVPGAAATVSPLPTNVVIIDAAVFSAVGSSAAVFDGTTVLYGPSSPFTTIYHHETITLGNDISFDGTRIGGPTNSGLQLGLAGGISISEIGESLAVISSTSLTVGPGVTVTTVFIDTYTIVANSLGLEVAGTTLTYPFNTITQILTYGGVTFSQIGSTILVLGGQTYTVRPTSSPTQSAESDPPTTSEDPAPSPTSPEPAAETSKDAGVALRPMYLLLSFSLLTCLQGII